MVALRISMPFTSVSSYVFGSQTAVFSRIQSEVAFYAFANKAMCGSTTFFGMTCKISKRSPFAVQSIRPRQERPMMVLCRNEL